MKQHDVVMGTDERFEYHDVLGRLTRYSRTILSAEGPLTLEEERRYEDATVASTGLRKVAISRTIQMVGGQDRHEQTEEYYDVAGRLREQVRFIAGARATWKYTYNERGQVRTLVAPTEGQATETTTYHYDSAGNLYRTEAPGDANNPAAITETVVDGEGRVIQQKGPHPDADWRFTYDAFGQLLSKELMATVGNPVGGRWSFAYGLQGKTDGDLTVPDSAVEETDPLGYKTYRFFNARYQLVKEVREDAPTVAGGETSTRKNTTTTTYAYAGPWLQKQVRTELTDGTNGPPSVLTMEHTKFDDRGRSLAWSERWQRGADSYEYVTKSPWAGRTVTVVQTGTVSASPEVVLPLRSFTVTTNSLGQVISREQGGLTDAWSYDAAGTLTKEQPAGRAATRYTYDQGLVVEMAFGEGALTEYTRMTYRLDGRLKSVTDPAQRVRSLSYGPRGLMVRETFGRDGVFTDTKYAYDAGGNVASIAKDPDNPGDAWLYKYGPLGELLSVTLPGLTAFTYGYDGLRRLTSIQRPPGGVPSEYFEYDYLGRTTSRVRGTSNWSTSWVNGVQQVTSPDNSEEAGGNDRDLVETLVDGRGRPVWKTFTPGPSSAPQQDITRLAFAYGASDELVQAHEHRISRDVLNTFSYDSRGRLTQVRRGKDSESDREDLVEYAYALNADLLKQRVSGVAEVEPLLVQELEYDLLGRINNVKTRNAGELASSRTVEWERGGGQIVRVADASLVERWCYDGRGLLEAVRTTARDAEVTCAQSPSSLKVGFRYTYDARGNRIHEAAQFSDAQGAVVSESTEYGYDKADRLTGVRYPDSSAVLYKLDGNGARLGERHVSSHSGSLLEAGYEQVSSPERQLTYGFDSAGGLKSIDDLAVDGSTRRFATIFTDGAGRVRRYERTGTDNTQHEWDSDGRLTLVRIEKSGPGEAQTPVIVKYRYGFDGLLRTRVAVAGASHYVWAGHELVEEQLARGVRLHQERVGGVTLSVGDIRVLHDGLGSAVGRVMPSGVLTEYRYDAWGNFRNGTEVEPDQPSIGFTGHLYDQELKNWYAQQRWLSPVTGAFLAEDPVRAESYLTTPTELNPWLYARGNPLKFTDPDGRSACFDGEDHGRCEARLHATGRWKGSVFDSSSRLGQFRGKYELLEEQRKRELEHNVRAAVLAVGVGVSLAAPPVALALVEGQSVSAPVAAVGLWGSEAVSGAAIEYGIGAEVTPEGVAVNLLTAGMGSLGFLGYVDAVRLPWRSVVSDVSELSFVGREMEAWAGGARSTNRGAKPFLKGKSDLSRRHVPQTGSHSCGAACGEMAAEHHGVQVTEARLTEVPEYTPPMIDPLQSEKDLNTYNRYAGYTAAALRDALNREAPISGRIWTGQDLLPEGAGVKMRVQPQEVLMAIEKGLRAGNGVFIARLDYGQHWVVVDGVSGNLVYVRDPAMPAADAWPLERFAERFTGLGLFAAPR
ncbi:RHS repeat domain-containing protein [Myxococcus sp. AB025B]|uniref:RHS repeat domain-containing protein n=1 Tax=Myxococcus sp. AB025B TaxID=2562794 RepID=UPI0011444B4A|nr:RHS repeat-associated core domain-containing protein [Myxococcus sp. AB025B]